MKFELIFGPLCTLLGVLLLICGQIYIAKLNNREARARDKDSLRKEIKDDLIRELHAQGSPLPPNQQSPVKETDSLSRQKRNHISIGINAINFGLLLFYLWKVVDTTLHGSPANMGNILNLCIYVTNVYLMIGYFLAGYLLKVFYDGTTNHTRELFALAMAARRTTLAETETETHRGIQTGEPALLPHDP